MAFATNVSQSPSRPATAYPPSSMNGYSPRAGGMQAYRPMQSKQRYVDDPGIADQRRQENELAAWQRYGYDAVNRQQPAYVDYGPGQAGVQKPQYGSRIGMPAGERRTMDFRDSDGDGMDDRYQTGPRQPNSGGSYRPPPGDPAWNTLHYHMGKPGAAQPNMPPSQGTPYGGAPRVTGQPGNRTAIVGGDMALSEALLGTERFNALLANNGGGTGQMPPPAYPPDFEGPLPGPRDPQSRQARQDDIYNQLVNGSYAARLKNGTGAGQRSQNARDLARRLAADGVPARYFEQYGVTPPGQAPRPNPGAAQPTMPQSPGTPYGGAPQSGGVQPSGGQSGAPQSGGGQPGTPQYGGGYQVPQGNDPVSQLGQIYQNSMLAWTQPKQQLLNWGQQVSQMPWGPNYGNTPDNRPSPWSQQVSGMFGNDQQGMWNNIGGFIQAVNNQAMQKPVGTYLGQGNPGPQYGKQNYDPSLMMQNAQQLFAGGWQNPFATPMQQMPQWQQPYGGYGAAR